MSAIWSDLEAECAQWRKAGLPLKFWWRDDDAVTVTPQFRQMIERSERNGIPVHLAIVPKHADELLVATCVDAPHLVPMVHGWAHQNHAPAGQKKAEFNHDRPDLRADARAGIASMQSLFGATLLPCFVPPWNRITPNLIRLLPDLGYSAVSTFGPRTTRTVVPGIAAINTHVDPIDWRGGGGLADTDALVAKASAFLRNQRLKARRESGLDAIEPLGLLTHHLVQDQATWGFFDRLLQTLMDGGAQPINLHVLRATLP